MIDELPTRLDALLASARKAVPADARQTNQSLILRALHYGGAASRAELAKMVGLTPATVSSVIRDLLDEGLVDEFGRTSGGVGKPATMVGIEPDGQHLVCLSLSAPDEVVAAIVNLAGKVVTRRSTPRDGRSGAELVDVVDAMARDLLECATRPVAGVGVATPGIVDARGTVLRAPGLGWDRLPLADRLSKQLHRPVVVANDANAAALAELTFGGGDSTDLLLVRIDQGVGVGVVLDGALFSGRLAAAGEIGHVVIDPTGTPCPCGKRGCLETEVAVPALERLRDSSGLSQEEVLHRAGTRLGEILAPVASALDISDIVLSGPQLVRDEPFRSATFDALVERTMAEIGDRIVVRPSAFGDDDVVVGAAVLVLDRELGIR